jgi:hypothetical protein
MPQSNVDRYIVRFGICVGIVSLVPYLAEGQPPGDSRSSSGTASRVVLPPTAPLTYVPLTQQQRLHAYLTQLVGPGALVESAASAGINQWRNTPGEWKQGSAAYGYRYASSFGIHVVNLSVQTGVGALLGEDNRYIRSSDSAFGRRLKYALLSTVAAHSRTGSRRVSISNISAFTAAAFVSRTWQPPSTSHVTDAMQNIGVSLGVSAAANVAREFLPRSLHLSWLIPN